MNLKSIIQDINENYCLHIVMVLFCIGIILLIDGIFMDPFGGYQYIKTTIKITSYNHEIDSYYSFNFNENFSCKQCLSTNNICSYDTPCPNIVIGLNYTYYCDCSKFICRFKPYNYYTTDAFIVLITGISLILTIICLTLIKCICSIKCNRKNNVIISSDGSQLQKNEESENKIMNIEIDIDT